MSDEAPRLSWKDWLLAISPAVLLIGAILSGGTYISQIKDNGRRIEALERKVDDRDAKLNTIDVRTARIEAKIEVLIPREKAPQ